MEDKNCWGITIEVDDELKKKGVYLGITCFETINKNPINYTRNWKKLLEETSIHIKEKYGSPENLRNNPIVRAYREFFWRHGIDPTKTRPAGEALVRRMLRGTGIRSINPVVDAGNLASIITLISIGLYDIEKIYPKQLVLRKSYGTETFKPIGGDAYIVRKDTPILTNEKQVIHIYPHRDSVETMVTENTKKILGIAAGLHNIPEDTVIKALQYTLEYLEKLGTNIAVKEKPFIKK